MVTRASALCRRALTFMSGALVLAGCAAREGTVLVARELSGDAGVPDISLDGAVAADARVREDGASEPTNGDAGELPSADDGGAALLGRCRIEGASAGFYENFGGVQLSNTWLIAHGVHTFAGSAPRGGFVRDNVAVRDGALVLSVRGDRYVGPVVGIEASGAARVDGKRSAGAVATRDLFASATYQIQGRLAGPPGVEVAMWVMADDDRAGGADLAAPGVVQGLPSYGAVRMRSRTGLGVSEQNQFALVQRLDDGASHILRFDWYTTSQPTVDFWVDDVSRWKATEQVLDGATRRLWIVAWVPDDAPADFDTAEIRIENAFVTPFGNDGDRCTVSEYTNRGLVSPLR
jgi:hypothetical protein